MKRAVERELTRPAAAKLAATAAPVPLDKARRGGDVVANLDDDGDRHRLWRTAFGLTPVRHLSVTSETEDAWAAADLGNATPWAEAPAVRVAASATR